VSETPWLPLSRTQAASLLRALNAAVEDRADAGGGTERLPRIPERVVVELVRCLRAERRHDLARSASPGRDARRRARRTAALGGLAGALGALPADALSLVEEARFAIDAAEATSTPGEDVTIAGDLLTLWGLVDDPGHAAAMCDGSSEGSLLDHLHGDVKEQIRDAIPDRWTPLSTLRFLWAARRVGDAREVLTGGTLRSIPVLAALPSAIGAHRDMRAFQRDVEAYYGAAARLSGGAS